MYSYEHILRWSLVVAMLRYMAFILGACSMSANAEMRSMASYGIVGLEQQQSVSLHLYQELKKGAVAHKPRKTLVVARTVLSIFSGGGGPPRDVLTPKIQEKQWTEGDLPLLNKPGFKR